MAASKSSALAKKALLKAAAANHQQLALTRGIAGKVMRMDWEPRPKPFPYWKREFQLRHALFDKCTKRFNENTKMVVVDGAHGVGKSEFAKALAEELDMLYVPEPSMDRSVDTQ